MSWIGPEVGDAPLALILSLRRDPAPGDRIGPSREPDSRHVPAFGANPDFAGACLPPDESESASCATGAAAAAGHLAAQGHRPHWSRSSMPR